MDEKCGKCAGADAPDKGTCIDPFNGFGGFCGSGDDKYCWECIELKCIQQPDGTKCKKDTQTGEFWDNWVCNENGECIDSLQVER